jgi:hypothetical protein
MSAKTDGRSRYLFAAIAVVAFVLSAAAARRDSTAKNLPAGSADPFGERQVADNRATLASMDSRELAELRARKARFDRLPASEQERLRDLHAALMAHPRSEALQCVMHRYVERLKTLDQDLAARLSDLPADQRLAEIRSARSEGQQLVVLSEPSREELQQFLRENYTPAEQSALYRLPSEELRRRLIRQFKRSRSGPAGNPGRSGGSN